MRHLFYQNYLFNLFVLIERATKVELTGLPLRTSHWKHVTKVLIYCILKRFRNEHSAFNCHGTKTKYFHFVETNIKIYTTNQSYSLYDIVKLQKDEQGVIVTGERYELNTMTLIMTMFFLLYVNYFPNCSKNLTFRIFAGDTNLFFFFCIS